MTGSAWPPPTPLDVQWRTIGQLRGVNVEPFKVRQVQLWGRMQWINVAGDVLCECGRMVPIAELCIAGNGHSVSPVGNTGDRVTAMSGVDSDGEVVL